jgi:general secretion pathway protein B
VSLILEALKKSEAERQLGRAPGLMTPMPGRKARRTGAWLWAIAGLVLVGLAIGLLWLARDAGDPGVANVPPVTPPPTPPSTATPALEPVRSATPQEPAAPPAKTAATAPGPSAATADSPALRPVLVDPPLPAPVPRDPEFESIERESIALAARIPPPGVAPRAEPAPLQPSPALPTRAADSLPRFDQLMPDVRDALPPLKQSMHVFAESEADRFVLIDGRRYLQGESIAPSLTIIAIRRDGTELDFDGRRFLLPRP